MILSQFISLKLLLKCHIDHLSNIYFFKKGLNKTFVKYYHCLTWLDIWREGKMKEEGLDFLLCKDSLNSVIFDLCTYTIDYLS